MTTYDTAAAMQEIKALTEQEQQNQGITAVVNQWLDAHPNVKRNNQARNFISNYVVKACGSDFSNPANFDRALEVRLKFENLAADLVKWFEAPSVRYFASTQKNWDMASHWLHAQDTVILGIREWEKLVLENLYTNVFEWEISTADLIGEIHKTGVGGRQDTNMLWFQNSEPAGGLLIDRFGLPRVQEAWQQIQKNFNKSASGSKAQVMDEWRKAEDQKAQDARDKRHAEPRFQLEAAKQLLGIVTNHRGGAHSQTERERQILYEMARPYLVYYSEKDKAAEKRYHESFELTGQLDPGVFQCLEAVKAKQNQLAGLGR